MRELSVRDALTKLHNRRHFDEQATTCSATRCATSGHSAW
jgi:PleD family two-component response regulator